MATINPSDPIDTNALIFGKDDCPEKECLATKFLYASILEIRARGQEAAPLVEYLTSIYNEERKNCPCDKYPDHL